MKLAFILAAWAVAAVTGSIYLWGLAAHFDACRDFCCGIKDAALTWFRCGEWQLFASGWYDLGFVCANTCLAVVVILAFIFSMVWALQ